jgi:hypothetical protein
VSHIFQFVAIFLSNSCQFVLQFSCQILVSIYYICCNLVSNMFQFVAILCHFCLQFVSILLYHLVQFYIMYVIVQWFYVLFSNEFYMLFYIILNLDLSNIFNYFALFSMIHTSFFIWIFGRNFKPDFFSKFTGRFNYY